MAGLGKGCQGFRNGPGKKNGGIQFINFKSAETLNPDPDQSSAEPEKEDSAGKEEPSGSNLIAPDSCNSQNYHPDDSSFMSKGRIKRDRNSGYVFGQSWKSMEMHLRSSKGDCEDDKMPENDDSNSCIISKAPEAEPLISNEQDPQRSVEAYLVAWKEERDPFVKKVRKLAYEVMALKTNRPNATDKLHSAANRVPIRIEFNTEPVFGGRGTHSFLCYVYMDGITVAHGQGSKTKDAKANAYEAALQKILSPHIRVVQLETKELQVSKQPFKTKAQPCDPFEVSVAKPAGKLPVPPSASGMSQKSSLSCEEIPSQHKESNLETAGLKRRFNEFKPLEDFLIVEPLIPIQDVTPFHTLRRSADFSHMLLEYEYFHKGESVRCIVKLENQVLADVTGVSKVAAKNTAAAQSLKKMKNICWIIKTKKIDDSESETKISKEEMLSELNEKSDVIGNDNIGHKLLRKMGWSGGGVGRDGSGIAEPVSLKSALNREGLGLSASKGVTEDLRKRVREVVEKYASSDNQEDLIFSCEFGLQERQIIHDECRKLGLRSKSRGKGQNRYICVRRKRTADQLFNHLRACGGETAKYILMPPGSDLGAVPSLNGDGVDGTGSLFGNFSVQGGMQQIQDHSKQVERKGLQAMDDDCEIQNMDSGRGMGIQNNGRGMGMQKMSMRGGMAMQNMSSHHTVQNMGNGQTVGRMNRANGQRMDTSMGMQNMCGTFSNQGIRMQNVSSMSMNHQQMGTQNMGSGYQTGMQNMGHNQPMRMQNWGTHQNFRGRGNSPGRGMPNFRYSQGRGSGKMRNGPAGPGQWNSQNGSGQWGRMDDQYEMPPPFGHFPNNSQNRFQMQGGWGSQGSGYYYR